MVSYCLQALDQNISGDITRPISCTISPAISQKRVISRRDTGRPGWPHDTARESDTRKRNISYAYQTSISPTVYRAISLRIVFHIIRGWYRYDIVWYWSTGKVDDMYRKNSHSRHVNNNPGKHAVWFRSGLVRFKPTHPKPNGDV